tara:strand:+ start:1332 stop:1808 length:477 start_codon:yes stop_codon:yes gene_type:complete
MSTTTFSGPIRAGKIKTTTGTTLGGNIFNLGQIVMAQTFETPPFQSGVADGGITDIVIPAKSQIINIVLDVSSQMLSGAASFSIGDTVGGPSTFINSYTITNGKIGRIYPTSEAGGALAWANTGPVDKKLTWLNTTTASRAAKIRFTVLYQQNNNLIA